jgi:hypothetical protein
MPGSSFIGNLPTFNESLKAHALTLWSTKIPFDGDPPIVDDASQTEEVFDWDDGPCVDLDFVPAMCLLSPPRPLPLLPLISLALFL